MLKSAFSIADPDVQELLLCHLAQKGEGCRSLVVTEGLQHSQARPTVVGNDQAQRD